MVLSGAITKTDLTVKLDNAFGWIISYNSETFLSSSAIIGKLTVVFCVSLMSFTHPLCESRLSTERAATLTFLLSNSALYFATVPNSVVQTGV